MSDHVPFCGACATSSQPGSIFCDSCGRALIALTARERRIIKAARDQAVREALTRECRHCLESLPHDAPSHQKFCNARCRKNYWAATEAGRVYNRARKKSKSVPRVRTGESHQVVRLRSEVSRQKNRAETWRSRAMAR